MQIVTVSLVSCESMQDSAKNPRHVAGYEKALTPDWAAVPLSIKSEEREAWEGRQTYDKKELKRRSVCCKRETKTLEGGRCPEAVLETEGCGGGETGRKMKEPPAVSPSPTLRSAPLSTDWGWDPNRRVLPFHTFPNISPNFPIQIHNSTCIFFP